MFLKVWQRISLDMSGECDVRPVIISLGAIDRVDDLSDESASGVRMTLDGGEVLECLASIDQVCEAIEKLTEGQGLAAIEAQENTEESCESDVCASE